MLKGRSSGQAIYVNGQHKGGSGGIGNFTVYVNPYLVLRSGGYTKHFYIEGQRITSKLGSGNGADTKNNKAGGSEVNYPGKQEKVQEAIVRNLKFLGQDGAILTAGKSGKIPPGQIIGGNNGGGPNKDKENFMYFFHPDHLGSSSYITDASGEVYQHLEYFAFGETFVEEHSNTDRTPYLFNGKELDEETGLYYYGARYYDPRSSVWQSVDPLAEKMPGWSAYNYTLNNPVVFVDPDGKYPITIHVRSFAPFDYFGFDLWKGDGSNRPFSTSLNHTSRIRQETNYETTNMTSSSKAFGGQSHSKYGANAFSDAEISYDQSFGNRIYTRLSGDNDAMIPGIDYGGPTHDIDVWTDMFISTTNKSDGSSILAIRGDISGDGFPSSEAFVSDSFGSSVFLGVGAAKAGSNKGPFWTLAGDKKEKQFSVDVRISVDRDGRFNGVYDGDKVISIGEWNKKFENIDPTGGN